MSISERLQMVIKMNGMTNASFADKIGVQRSSISHVLAERNKPSIDFIQKILSTFPKVDADWLITGKKIGRTIPQEDSSADLKSIDRKEEQRSISFAHSHVKDEDTEFYEGRIPNHPLKTEPEIGNKQIDSRKISRIIVFYTDGTFEELASIE